MKVGLDHCKGKAYFEKLKVSFSSNPLFPLLISFAVKILNAPLNIPYVLARQTTHFIQIG